MAAHGLTIVRQLLRMIKDGQSQSTLLMHASGALSAPGTCITGCFDYDDYRAVDNAVEHLRDGSGSVEALTAVLIRVSEHLAWMDAYPSLEAVQDAMTLHVKIGKPHWRKRMDRFEKGNPAVHAAARAAITARWPLDRRAPAVL